MTVMLMMMMCGSLINFEADELSYRSRSCIDYERITHVYCYHFLQNGRMDYDNSNFRRIIVGPVCG